MELHVDATWRIRLNCPCAAAIRLYVIYYFDDLLSMLGFKYSATVLLKGFLMFKDFCENVCEEPVPQIAFYEEVCSSNQNSFVTTRGFKCDKNCPRFFGIVKICNRLQLH